MTYIRLVLTSLLTAICIILSTWFINKPSTVISEQPPTGLIPRHIKSQPGLQSASQVTYITGKWVRNKNVHITKIYILHINY